ncbi:MAG: serine/threonine-protein kinase [Acidobacteriota bacterium]
MQLPSEPRAEFPYIVDKQVGIGSMGVVYKARETSLDRTVAIKTLRGSILADEPPEVQDELRRRFEQEARAAGRLSHPGITTVYRVGEVDSVPFMVMEWLDGRSLDEVLRGDQRMPVHDATRMVVELLDALGEAHRHGVVHRDIKPSNIMLLRSGRLKVTDFGIARIQGHDLVKTQAGIVLATPKFAAPEQLRGSEVDARADLYATGVLLYVLLSGAYPFEGSTFMELANAILTREPTPLRQLLPDLPPALDAVVGLALRKERQDRYASAAEMADDLRPFANASSSEATAPVAGRASLAVQATIPTLRHLSRRSAQALVAFAETWSSRRLEPQPSAKLLDRLLDRPLHAPAFAGAAHCGDLWLFFEDGVLLGAVDSRSGATGDEALAQLPEHVEPRLHSPPSELPGRLVSVAAGMLHPPRLLHSDLDSTFTDLEALAQKLETERFDGTLLLRRGEDEGRILFVEGRQLVGLFSEGWDGLPVDTPWQTWSRQQSLHAQVEKRTLEPPSAWYRRVFRDVAYDVSPVERDQSEGSNRGEGTTSSRLRQLFTGSSTRQAVSQMAMRLDDSSQMQVGGVELAEAPAVRLLDWALTAVGGFFAERSLSNSWRYLAEWLPLVRRAIVHHDLPRPGSRESDTFDAVTFDDKGKVLHLLHHLEEPTPEAFEAFVQRVVDAKTARTKTGDVGGVVLAVPRLTDELIDVYRGALHHASSGSWFGVEESFTGYAGFVRIGPRRGFHLLLIEVADEVYQPFLP